MRDLIFVLLATLTLSATVDFLITPNILNFNYLANSYISGGGKYIYTIVFQSYSQKLLINRYDINYRQILLNNIYHIQQQNHVAWQILEIQKIIAFPFISQSKLQLFYTDSPQPYTSNQNHQQFFQIINSNRHLRLFFSSFNGNIFYIDKTVDLILDNYNLISGSQHFGNTYISLSPDQNFLCSTDQYTGIISIWSAYSLALLYQFQTNQTGIRCHTWNQNSLFLYVIGYTNGTLYEYDLTNTMILKNKSSLNIKSISNCFYYYQTNQILAFSQENSSIITISLSNDYSFMAIPTFIGAELMNVDNSSRYFTIFNNNSASFYEIKSMCLSNQYYNNADHNCYSCGIQCTCCNAFSCFSCSQGYALSSDYWNCYPVTHQLITHANNIVPDLLNETAFLVINFTFNLINNTIKIPGHRQVLNIFFEMFSSFDHLILYIYHNRTYGPNMKYYLQMIHNTIDYRFNIIQDSICLQYFGVDFAVWQTNIDFKLNYSLPKFIDIETNGEGFFVNNLQYFFLNIPLITIALLFMRLVFKILFNYPLSALFRKFSFFGIIVFFLLEGNTQLFSFSFAADFLHIFSSNFTDKMINANTIIAGFLFINLATLGIFFIYLSYKKYSGYLYENCYGFYLSSFFCMMMNGILNIIRGFLHRLMINFKTEQMVVLTFVQIYEIFFQVYFISQMKIFISNFVQILFICANFSRIVLNISLMMDNYIDINEMDTIHIFVIFSTMFLFILGSIHSTIQVLIFIKHLIFMSIQQMKMNRKKQRQNLDDKNDYSSRTTINTNKSKSLFNPYKIQPILSPNNELVQMNTTSLNQQNHKKIDEKIQAHLNHKSKKKNTTNNLKNPKRPTDAKTALRIVFSKNPIIKEQKLTHLQIQK